MRPRTIRTSRTVVGAVAAAVLAVTLGGCAGARTGPGVASSDDDPSARATVVDDATTHNGVDVRFAQAMVMHHRGAIAMADLAAESTDDPAIRELAEAISAAQGPEIDLMTGWLDEWGEDDEYAMPGMDHDGMDMDGMMMNGMSQDDAMAHMRGLAGADRDEQFLELMIAHHEGAITMSEQELAEGLNPDARALATRIIADQTAEITTMRNLLDER